MFRFLYKTTKRVLGDGNRIHFPASEVWGVQRSVVKKYKELHGDCYVCDKYDTRNDQYSEQMRGNNILYKYVNCIRTGHIYQDQKSKDELEAMGFDFYNITGVDFDITKEM